MSRVVMAFWVVLILLVLAAGYVRLAPSDPGDWHVPLAFEQDSDLSGGVQRVIAAEDGTLERLDAVIRAHPRTRVLAGSVAEGHITYVTRSRVMGFPDYVTVQRAGDTLRIYSRLRFGQSDLGVNKARLTGWLDALQAG